MLADRFRDRRQQQSVTSITHHSTAYHHPEGQQLRRALPQLEGKEVWTSEYRSLTEATDKVTGGSSLDWSLPSRPSRYFSRQQKSLVGVDCMSLRRAARATDALVSNVSSTIRRVSSSDRLRHTSRLGISSSMACSEYPYLRSLRPYGSQQISPVAYFNTEAVEPEKTSKLCTWNFTY